jgi:hypothetical protein
MRSQDWWPPLLSGANKTVSASPDKKLGRKSFFMIVTLEIGNSAEEVNSKLLYNN